jgi:hypothetical protein
VIKIASPATPLPESAIRRFAPFPVGSLFTRNEAAISSTNSQKCKINQQVVGFWRQIEGKRESSAIRELSLIITPALLLQILKEYVESELLLFIDA